MAGRRDIATAALVAILAAVCVGEATAHTRSQSRSTWWIDGSRVTAVFTSPVLEVTRLGAVALADLPGRFARHLDSSVSISSRSGRCAPLADAVVLPAEPGFVRAERSFACDDTSSVSIDVELFLAVAPSHLHMADIRFAGEPARDYLFSDSQRRREVHRSSQRGQTVQAASALEYMLVGAQHIAAGWDHLAFLVALMLLCTGVREVVFAVTGFTIGHSVTLAAAVLGWIEPNQAAVEALIGYTIAIAALETAVAGPATARRAATLSALAGSVALMVALVSQEPALAWAVGGLLAFSVCYLGALAGGAPAVSTRIILTGLFGLIHGLGFASVLIDMGLPADRLLIALLGFNLGVEAGQIAVVGLLGLLAVSMSRVLPPGALQIVYRAGTGGLLALGVFWLVVRSAG